MEPVIRIANLSKIYTIGQNSIAALNGVDLDVVKGEFLCIVGRSGSGKSTLLNMMAGLERPTTGSITISGKPIEKLSESQLVRFRLERVGFIFQSFNLFPALTAEENVAVPLTYRGMPRKKRVAKARGMLAEVGLETHLKHRPTQMSGGQQQRVGIARALVASPEIIFADEPTGNLDSKTSAEVLDIMRNIVISQGHTLVLVTHDPEVAKWGDRVVHILDGKIIAIEVNEHPGSRAQTEAAPPAAQASDEAEGIAAAAGYSAAATVEKINNIAIGGTIS